MPKQKMIIFLILIGTIIISGCTKNDNQQNNQEDLKISEMIKKCDDIQVRGSSIEKKRKIVCYSNIGIIAKNISICNNLNDGAAINQCYSEIAKNNGDIGICNKEINGDIANCVTGVAIKKKDFSTCDHIKGFFQTVCYNSVVMANGGNSTTCETFSGQKDKDLCYYILSSKGKEYCNNIKEDELKEDCKQQNMTIFWTS